MSDTSKELKEIGERLIALAEVSEDGDWMPHKWSVIGSNPTSVYEYRSAVEYRSHDKSGRLSGWIRIYISGAQWLGSSIEREIPEVEAKALIAKWAAEREAKVEAAATPLCPECGLPADSGQNDPDGPRYGCANGHFWRPLTADDGGIAEDVLCLKVPELVEALVANVKEED